MDVQNASVKVSDKGLVSLSGQFFAGFEKGLIFVRVVLLVAMFDRAGMQSNTFALTLTLLWV